MWKSSSLKLGQADPPPSRGPGRAGGGPCIGQGSSMHTSLLWHHTPISHPREPSGLGVLAALGACERAPDCNPQTRSHRATTGPHHPSRVAEDAGGRGPRVPRGPQSLGHELLELCRISKKAKRKINIFEGLQNADKMRLFCSREYAEAQGFLPR